MRAKSTSPTHFQGDALIHPKGEHPLEHEVIMRVREKPRILLMDDQAVVRQGRALVLEEEGVGDRRKAGGQEQALDVADREAPDIALVDPSMGNDNTLALIAELRVRRIPVLVCSTDKNPGQVKRAMAAVLWWRVFCGSSVLPILRCSSQLNFTSSRCGRWVYCCKGEKTNRMFLNKKSALKNHG